MTILQQELSEIRTRIRNLQKKVLNKVKKPIYYSTLRLTIDDLIDADKSLSVAEVRLHEYLTENKIVEE